jgi:hypothetical protein
VALASRVRLNVLIVVVMSDFMAIVLLGGVAWMQRVLQ